MEEASKMRKRISLRRRRRKEGGQAMLEYILLLVLATTFLRIVYFNKDFGIKTQVDKTMLRLGAFLEMNLKTGTRVGQRGEKSLDPYAGTSEWTN